MTNILIYDSDSETVEKICSDNGMSEAELIELLLEYVDTLKEEYALK